EGHAPPHTCSHHTIGPGRLREGLGDGSRAPDTVQDVEVMIVASRNKLLGVDVLSESGTEVAGFEIVGRHGVSREKRVTVAGFDELPERVAAVPVKDDGGSRDPHDVAVVALVAQKVVEVVVAS